MDNSGQITRDHALAKAKDLRDIAKEMDGHNNYPMHNGDGPESLAQRIRQAAFVIEMTAPREVQEQEPPQ